MGENEVQILWREKVPARVHESPFPACTSPHCENGRLVVARCMGDSRLMLNVCKSCMSMSFFKVLLLKIWFSFEMYTAGITFISNDKIKGKIYSHSGCCKKHKITVIEEVYWLFHDILDYYIVTVSSSEEARYLPIKIFLCILLYENNLIILFKMCFGTFNSSLYAF